MFAALTFLAPLQAYAWDTELRLGAGAIYSDNIELAPRGEEESDLVLYVVPGIAVSREGGRVALALDYSLTSLAHTEDSDRNTTFHQLSSLATAELIKELLFLDADASYSQRLTTDRPALGTDIIGRPGDFSDVLTYRLSPYMRYRLGAYADAELRYRYEVIDYRDDPDLDSESNQVNLRIAGSAALQLFDWVLRYDRETIDYDDDTSTEFERYSGLLRVDPTEQIGLYVEAGREKDAFDRGDERSRPSGDLWRAGVIWTPTTRTRVEGFYADRYFGSYFGGSLRHRTPSGTWAFDYEEEPSTSALIVPDLAGSPGLGEDERPILDDDGNPVILDGDFPATTSEPFLRRRATLAVQGQRSRTAWRVRVFREQRDFEFSGQEETVTGAGLGLSYRIAPRTQLLTDYDWLRTEGQDQLGTERSQLIRLGLQHDLGPRTTLFAGYRFVDSDGVEGGEEPYQENRAILFINTRF